MLTRRALPQPHPFIVTGGDCGACSLGGALGISVPEVYSRFSSDGITHNGEMARCLRCAVSYQLADRMIDERAEFPGVHYLHAFGHPAVHSYVAWFNYVRMAIDAGYYGIANVDFDGNGGPDTNHWVLVCGARHTKPESSGILTGDVLISCSVRGEQWYEARDFLRRMGGYDVRFVRPIE